MTADCARDRFDRKEWMSLVASAPAEEVLALWQGFAPQPGFDWLRRPEVGAVMVRGRMGATGAAFNLGEMTVTRCSLTIAGGVVGHGYVQGRSKSHAEAAALIDAVMQTGAGEALAAAVLAPLRSASEARRGARAARAAATKVEFFTMVRGEDA